MSIPLLYDRFYEMSYAHEFFHNIRAYHRINVAHTTYPVTKTKKNTGLYVRESVEKYSDIACGQDIWHIYKE